jgi:hypothetical protein
LPLLNGQQAAQQSYQQQLLLQSFPQGLSLLCLQAHLLVLLLALLHPALRQQAAAALQQAWQAAL